MAERTYEGLFILDSDKFARDQEEISNQIAQTIESLGGTIKVSRLWEEKRLAYPIDQHKRGTYWLVYFTMDTDKMKDLNRQFTINGNVIRHLIIRIDPRLVEPLVEHALNDPVHHEEEGAGGEPAVSDIPEEETEEPKN